MKKVLKYVALTLGILIVCSVVFLFTTNTGHQIRRYGAEIILSSQHRSYAKFMFLPQSELDEILKNIEAPKYVNSMTKDTYQKMLQDQEKQKQNQQDVQNKQETENHLDVTIEPIEKWYSAAYHYKGQIMYVSNSKAVKLVTSQRKDWGEQINVLADRAGALAAVNAGGFVDVNGVGNGGTPVGIVVEDGQIKHSPNDNPNDKDYVAAINNDGLLITGYYSPNDLLSLGTKYAAGFRPQLIVNGQKMIADPDGGWGIGPRTAIGQKADGTLMFLVIDGRQTQSTGATVREVQDILYDKGAVNAICMDGGSSASMYANHKLLTIPSSVGHIPRYLPNAWVVVPTLGMQVTMTVDGQTVNTN